MAPSAQHCWPVKGCEFMESVMFIQYLSSVISIGLGCGTCCSPSVGMFLSTYTMAHAQNLKKAVSIFLHFFFGKLSAILLVCSVSCLLGKQWISKEGYIGTFSLNDMVDKGLLFIGIFLIIKWVWDRRKGEKKCNGHCQGDTPAKSKWPPYAIGFLYGMTPCAPMVLLIGYALVLPLGPTILLSLTFCIVSSISPLLIMIFIAGILSQKMYQEIPKWIEWIRLFCYILFLLVSIFNITY